MPADLTIGQFQKHIADRYEKHDRARGTPGTWLHFSEEIGELARALARNDNKKSLEDEFADVLAWLATIANVAGIDLEQAVFEKYGRGCPGCGQLVCRCDSSEKP